MRFGFGTLTSRTPSDLAPAHRLLSPIPNRAAIARHHAPVPSGRGAQGEAGLSSTAMIALLSLLRV